MAAATTDQLRRLNTARVLRSLRESGPASRAALAQRTGLAKATVGTIIAELHRLGAVQERPHAGPVPKSRTTTGRPGRPVSLDGAATVGLGLEVNVEYVAATALDLAGRTVLSRQVPTLAGHELGALSELAQRCWRQLADEDRRLVGIGVAVPGLVDRSRGVVVAAPNLGWHGLDLAEAVAAAVGGSSRVSVDNDANCSALAEATFGVARGVDQVLYLTGTVGLGAGLVVDGVVQRGSNGFGGEVGHLPVGGSTRRCACGRRGCWETTVGLRAMLRATHSTATGDPVDLATDMARLAKTDTAVRAAVRELAGWLGTGILTLAGVLDPAMVVLGGYFVPLGPLVVPVVERSLRRGLLAADSRRCTVALSTLGLHAASTGAAADVLAEVFDGTLALT